MNKLMELVDLHADAVCNVLEGAEDATSGKSWLTIRDVFYAEIQAIADSIVKSEPLYVIPKGYKLVPLEPTEEMIDNVAGFTHTNKYVYKAMLEVAPSIDEIEGDL